MVSRVQCRHAVQAIPVAIGVLVKSPLSWSDNNQVALATQHGTFIFELNITTEETSPYLMYNRDIIFSTQKPNESFDTGIFASKAGLIATLDCIHGSDNTKVHKYMLDSALSATKRVDTEKDPKNRFASLAMPGGETNHAGFKKCLWSPRNVDLNGGCILCMVTYDHKVIFVGRRNNSWEELCDLSKFWLQWLKKNQWKNEEYSSVEARLSEHIERAKWLSIQEFLWTPFMNVNNEQICLFVSTYNGHLVIWKIDRKAEDLSLSSIISVSYICDDEITALNWYKINDYQAYLIIGCFSGNVYLYHVTLEENDAIVASLGSVENMNDRLSVLHLFFAEVEADEKEFIILMAKQNFLFVALLSLKNNSMTVLNLTALIVGRLGISGMHFSDNVIYLCLKDGYVTSVNLSLDCKEIILNIGDRIFKSEGISYNGMGLSPNKVFCAVVETVCVPYDHLVIREPTQISFYLVADINSIVDYMMSQKMDPLHHYVDVLESYRLCLHKGEMNDLTIPSNDMIAYLPLYKKQVYLWIMKVLTNFTEVIENITEERTEEVKWLLERVIIEENMRSSLQLYNTRSLETLTEFECASLKLVYQWFTTYGNDDDKEMVQEICESVAESTPDEVCLVCDDVVLLNILTYGRCAKGHTLPRCISSLKLAQPLFYCKYCLIFVHRDLYEKGNAHCLFCHSPIIAKLSRRT